MRDTEQYTHVHTYLRTLSCFEIARLNLLPAAAAGAASPPTIDFEDHQLLQLKRVGFP